MIGVEKGHNKKEQLTFSAFELPILLLVFVIVLDDTLPTLEELLLTPLSSLPCLELETMLLPHTLQLLSPLQAPELPLFLVLETLEDTLPPMELLEMPLLALLPIKDEVTIVHAITIHSTVATIPPRDH